MRKALWMILAAALAAGAFAQPPAGDRSSAVQRAQMRVTAAYDELVEAEYQLKLADQDYVNTQDAYRTVSPPSGDIKRELDKTKKALDAARIREARARKAYDAALDAVEKAWGRPPKNR